MASTHPYILTPPNSHNPHLCAPSNTAQIPWLCLRHVAQLLQHRVTDSTELVALHSCSCCRSSIMRSRQSSSMSTEGRSDASEAQHLQQSHELNRQAGCGTGSQPYTYMPCCDACLYQTVTWCMYMYTPLLRSQVYGACCTMLALLGNRRKHNIISVSTIPPAAAAAAANAFGYGGKI